MLLPFWWADIEGVAEEGGYPATPALQAASMGRRPLAVALR